MIPRATCYRTMLFIICDIIQLQICTQGMCFFNNTYSSTLTHPLTYSLINLPTQSLDSQIGSTGLAGKETIVLNGLSAARRGIDDFVSLFPKDDVSAVLAKIEAENELNRAEFDSRLTCIFLKVFSLCS